MRWYLFALVLAVPLPAVAQPDINAAIDAVLACERAEHEAWSYGFGQLNEQYQRGTERQWRAAFVKVDAVLDVCEVAMASLPAILTESFREDVWLPWRTLGRDAESPDAMLADLLQGMRYVLSTPTLAGLLTMIDNEAAIADDQRVASVNRRIVSGELRMLAEATQAAIGAAASDLAAWRYDAESETTADGRREARAQIATVTRKLTALRSARRRQLAAMTSWRRGAARAGVLRELSRSVDAEEYPRLEALLSE